MAANYSTGNYPIFRLEADGSIGPKTDDFQGIGNGAGRRATASRLRTPTRFATDLEGKRLFGSTWAPTRSTS